VKLCEHAARDFQLHQNVVAEEGLLRITVVISQQHLSIIMRYP